jgi:multiple sugar transport system permease protein
MIVLDGIKRRRRGVFRRSANPRAAVGKAAATSVVLLWCLSPLVWLMDTSLKIGNNALNSPLLTHGPFGFNNYLSVFRQGFGDNMRNSAIVAGITTMLCVSVSSLAAYALARSPLRRRGLVLSGILAASLFPPIALVVPLYGLWRAFGLLDTYPGLYIPYVALTLPLTIFILTTFFASIPWEIEEAAWVDGATPLQAFSKVIMPLAVPGVSSASLLVFVYSWNEFLLASIVAPRSLAVQTVPVAISAFTGSVPFERPIGTVTAACVIVTVPMILLVFRFQRNIVAGLTAGAVKG